jgi:hypothetical protein
MGLVAFGPTLTRAGEAEPTGLGATTLVAIEGDVFGNAGSPFIVTETCEVALDVGHRL